MSEVALDERVGNVQKVDSELVHKSNIYFDFFSPKQLKDELSPRYTNKLRHGDVYIYLDQLILHEHGRWFRIKVTEIVEIKQVPKHNQIIIKVGCFDLVICCGEDGQLQAINNFLDLTLSYIKEQEQREARLRLDVLANGNKIYRKLKVKVPQDYSRIST